MTTSVDELFAPGDPFDDPLWQAAELVARLPPRPPKGYVTCPLGWLARALPMVRTSKQLVILLLIYRKCLMARAATVSLSSGDLDMFGMSRFAKYRALAWLEAAGAVVVEKGRGGRAVRVTLRLFP